MAISFLLHGVFVGPVSTTISSNLSLTTIVQIILVDMRAVVCIVFLTVTLYLFLIRIHGLHGTIDLLLTEAARRSQRRISEKAVLSGRGKVRILSCFKLLCYG